MPIPEMDPDEFELEVIDAGAEDVDKDDEYVTVTCALEDFGNLNRKFEELGISPENAELQRIPNTTNALENDAFSKVMKLIDQLEESDDVQKIYHNMEVTESQMELI